VIVKTRRGFQKLEWQKLRERNEVLGCRVYARAAAWIVGVDRWTEAKGRDLEDQLGSALHNAKQARPADETKLVTTGLLTRPRATGKRRSNWIAVDEDWLAVGKRWLR
jgi:phage terminase large subunit GpA-like protein